jgi:hypothetical protein
MPGIGIGIGIGIGHRPPPPKVKFDMFENGLDFINEAVKIINSSSDHRRLKYAVIHLCSGVELILKEVLKNKDWRFLFQELKEAKPELLQSGDFESVSFMKSINRLESECKIRFTDDDKKTLIELRLKRNKIEHFKVDEKVSALKSLSAKVLNFLIQFIHTNINQKSISALSKKYIRTLPKELLKFNSFVTERNQVIKKKYDQKVKQNIIAIKCPDCFQKTLFVDTHMTCLFCNYSNNPDILSSEYNRTFNPTSQTNLTKCANCSTNSLIESDDKIICLSCRKITENQKSETSAPGL